MNLIFNKIFRILWLLFFVLLIFIDRDIIFNKIFLIFFLIILTIITVFRILDSRNEWREIVKDEEKEKE